MYTSVVTDDFKVIVYDPNGNVLDNPGPWVSREEAESWASMIVDALNSGSFSYENGDND